MKIDVDQWEDDNFVITAEYREDGQFSVTEIRPKIGVYKDLQAALRGFLGANRDYWPVSIPEKYADMFQGMAPETWRLVE